MGKDVDARSDVYSLGCVAFELLTGQAPICGENALQTLFMHVNEQPLTFEQANKSVSLPESLQAVLLKSLEKTPAKRFSTAAEFGEAITDAIMNDTRSRQQVSKEGWTVYKKPLQHAESNPSPVNEQTIPPPLPKQNDEQSKRNLAESKISLPPPLPVQQEEDEKRKRGLAESKISLPPPLPVQPEVDEKKKRNLAESKISLPPPLPVQQDQKGTTPPPIPRDLESSIPPPLPHEQKSTVPPPLPRQDEFNLRAPEKPKGLTADKRGTEKKDQTPPTTLPEATTTKNGGSGGDTQRTLKKEALSKDALNKESELQPGKKNYKVFAGIGALAVVVYVFFFSPLHLYDQAIGVFDPYAKSIAAAQELFDAGKYHDASQQYEDILPKAREKFGEKSRGYEAVLFKLCQSMSNAHTNPQQLSKYLDQCIEILKDEKDEAAVSDRAELCLMRGFLFDDQGQYWSAINEFRTALALRKERFGDGTPKVAHALSLLGEEYKKANNLTDADSELSAALRMYKDQQVPDYVALIETSLALGDVKNQSNQFAEAEKLVQNARDYRSKLPDQESIQSQELKTKIATLDENVSQNKLKHSLPPAAVAPSPAVPPAPVIETGSKAAAILKQLETPKRVPANKPLASTEEILRKAKNRSNILDRTASSNRAITTNRITTTNTSTNSKPYSNPYINPYVNPYQTAPNAPITPPGSVMPANNTTANPFIPDDGTVWKKFGNIRSTPTPPPTNIYDPSIQGSRGAYDRSGYPNNVSRTMPGQKDMTYNALKRSKNLDGSTRWDPYYNTPPSRPNVP